MSTLPELLAERFKQAKREAWQGYGLVGFPPYEEDHRQICFDQLLATIDALPELLSDQAKPYRSISEFWFDREIRNLGERVGWDFFPGTAADFVWRLLSVLSRSVPSSSALREMEQQQTAWADQDMPFCDPIPIVTT